MRGTVGNRWLGILGIAVALLLILSLILSAFFCTFPWSIVARTGAALG